MYTTTRKLCFPHILNANREKILRFFTPIVIVAAILLGWNYYDVMWWVYWYKIIEMHGLGGLVNIYKLCLYPECKIPYPPLAIIIFTSIYSLATFLPPIARIAVLKIFLVFLPGLAIYAIVKKLRGSNIALNWLLCVPFLQILFALQFDVLLAFLILISTLAIAQDKINRSAIFLALATMIKHVVIILVPLHIVFLWITKGFRQVLRYAATYFLVAACLAMPFFVIAPREFINHILLFHSSRAPQDLSLWALPTFILEEDVVAIQHIIDNLWAVPFIVCYVLFLYLYTCQLRLGSNNTINRSNFLFLYTSITLLLFITLNKIGNLNYVVWFIPTAFIVLSKKHLRTMYILTTILGVVGALNYAFMLYIPPASINAPMFIVEDLNYWNARALIAQSLNYYLFIVTSILRPFLATITETISSPTDFVSQIPIFKTLLSYRSYLMISAMVVTQMILTTLLVLKIKWLKEYNHIDAKR